MSDEDALRRLFRDAQPEISDDGFAHLVMQRVDRLRRRRRIVLGSAAAIGSAAALPALWQATQTLAAAPWANLAGPWAIHVTTLCVGAALWLFTVSVEA